MTIDNALAAIPKIRPTLKKYFAAVNSDHLVMTVVIVLQEMDCEQIARSPISNPGTAPSTKHPGLRRGS